MTLPRSTTPVLAQMPAPVQEMTDEELDDFLMGFAQALKDSIGK
jgi:hypothetical protein